ncbi:hypothetical protein JOB18_022343 [Solea senegalensis]|uniref:Uncharacterized protein n=1 Tax=Solea senegalensis TaxID=28829 RepID=A0AAV6RZ38_SOLSE|nr:hypothetical protein JOB18_022343 [Solea senegalensis]
MGSCVACQQQAPAIFAQMHTAFVFRTLFHRRCRCCCLPSSLIGVCQSIKGALKWHRCILRSSSPVLPLVPCRDLAAAGLKCGGPASREGLETTSLLPPHCVALKVVRPHCPNKLRSDLGSVKEKFSSNEAHTYKGEIFPSMENVLHEAPPPRRGRRLVLILPTVFKEPKVSSKHAATTWSTKPLVGLK